MAVFPEAMNRLDAHDVKKSLDLIERYISYMTERVEHANRNNEKATAELLGKITALEARITALEKRMEEPEATLAEQEENVEVPEVISETPEEETEVTEQTESNEGGA